LYEIIFYRDSSGKQAVLEYMEKLRTIRSKDSRIKLNKINDYVTALSVYGKELLTGNYVKHLEGEICLPKLSAENMFCFIGLPSKRKKHRAAK